MMTKLVKHLFAFCIAFAMQSAFATQIDKIIIFGDSLSDNHNIYSFTMKAHKAVPLIPIIPKNPPYFDGRFSNGYNWIDNLSTEMNVPLEDYAYGGSWAEPVLDSQINVPFGLDLQVAYYLVKSTFDFHKDQHLYIIWTGANDYIKGRSDPDYATTNTVATIKKQIEWLLFAGAKNIYVMNVPDISVTPQVMNEGADFALKISQMVEMHNRKLVKAIHELQKDHGSDNIILSDTTQYFTDLLINPGKYGLKNTTEPCYNGGYWIQNKFANIAEVKAANMAGFGILESPSIREVYLNSRATNVEICANPDEYLFWDHIHPTRATHTIISRLTLQKLQEHNIHS